MDRHFRILLGVALNGSFPIANAKRRGCYAGKISSYNTGLSNTRLGDDSDTTSLRLFSFSRSGGNGAC